MSASFVTVLSRGWTATLFCLKMAGAEGSAVLTVDIFDLSEFLLLHLVLRWLAESFILPIFLLHVKAFAGGSGTRQRTLPLPQILLQIDLVDVEIFLRLDWQCLLITLRSSAR